MPRLDPAAENLMLRRIVRVLVDENVGTEGAVTDVEVGLDAEHAELLKDVLHGP